MPNIKNDFLKYWSVIRYFVRAKYGLNQEQLDLILFLYSEKYFTLKKFEELDNVLRWDKKRLVNMINDGWIEIFVKKTGTNTIYKLSYKSLRLCISIYDKLNGNEIPTSPCHNPMFRKKVGFSDKVYKHMIINMNDKIKKKKLNPELDLDGVYD